MKWTALFLLAAGLVSPGFSQDAATQERLDQLRGQIDDMVAAQKVLQRQISALSKDMDQLRESVGRPNANYASVEDVKRVADAIRAVDQKRVQDAERVQAELQKLAKVLSTPVKPVKPTPTGDTGEDKAHVPDKFFRHTVGQGDTLSTIAAAYKEKGVKVTIDQILKANPGLKPERLKLGQEIIIPAP